MEFIHTKCLEFKDTSGVMLICGRSKGHTSPQCYDPDEDVYFYPEHKSGNGKTGKK